MNLHLAEISTQITPGAVGVVIWPTAPAGTSQAVNCELPGNIRLLRLPPYSPELNPMERVWDYLRQNKLCATVWDSYDDIIKACAKAWSWR